MTNAQALAKAKKRYGKSYYVRAGESFSSPDRRAKGRTSYQEARTEIEAIEADIKKRLSELEWYQELRARQRVLRKVSDGGQGSALYYRFTVGKSNGMFTTVLGQGDTWEEAFAVAEKQG